LLDKIIKSKTRELIKIEYLVSACGAFVCLLIVALVSKLVLDQYSALVLSASMGASAVLLFHASHSPMAQPWPLVGGHIVSALIGVACARHIEMLAIAAPLAAALSIFAMAVLRCVHPPGGAAALLAVVGGKDIQALGYQFVITPVLINVVIMLIATYLINNFLLRRPYPTPTPNRSAK